MSQASPSPEARPRVVIIGAGPGGLCMAIQLKRAGFENFEILERGHGVGGTWYHNRYPGCACDIPSHLYSFSFEIKTDWSRPYAPQPEILEYMNHCAEKYDVLPHCRFGAEVSSAQWREEPPRWEIELTSGERVEAEIVVSAIGMFNELAYPDVEGLDRFTGTSFHSARWNWDHDLDGRRVGVIGSAASAVQFVPEIVKTAGHVTLFQRSANWVIPKEDTPFTEKQLAEFRANPELVVKSRDDIFSVVDAGMTFQIPGMIEEVEKAGIEALQEVKDPEVREKLRPTHPFGCKRPLYSNDYFAAFNRENLELVTDAIERITEDAVLTEDGRRHEIDTLILATGFAAGKYLSSLDVRGRDGTHIEEAWRDGARAYLGITTAGFPNLFMLYGPNTNNGSILSMIESQVDYCIGKIQQIAEERLAWIDVRPEPMERYNEEVQEAIAGIDVWHAGCNGYYRSASGRVVTQWPYSMSEFATRTRASDSDVFDVARR